MEQIRKKIIYTAVMILVVIISPAHSVNTTIVGALGDLDGNGDGGAGEAAIVQAAATCWDARVTTNRNFTLTVTPVALTGGTLGTGSTSSVDGNNNPNAGNVNIDNDGSTNWYVDPSPLDSLEFNPDPVSQWRFINGPAQSDLWSTLHHEVGHAFGWLCGVSCNFTNPNYDALMVPAPGSFVANTACAPPFPLAGQAPLPGCAHLTANPFDVSLRGDGLGGSGSSVVNELSHPGIGSDLMEGFSGAGQRETPSRSDIEMFRRSYNDTVNLPLTINAGADISAECSAIGGASVTLDASGSTDPENDALTYGWNCPGVALSNNTVQNPSGFFSLNQTTNCRLDATDVPACAPDADTVNVTVVDTTAPAINCPADIVVQCTAPSGSPASDLAITSFLNSTNATDICDASVSISNNAPGFFGLGSTPVSFNTSDDSGNPANCNATVNVVDVFGTQIPADISIGETDFGTVSAWSPGEKDIEVCNIGGCPLTASSASVDCTDFTIVNNPLPAPLSPGACTDLTIKFTPTVPGPHSCNLSVSSDDPDSPIVSKTLTARTPPAFSIHAGVSSASSALGNTNDDGLTINLDFIKDISANWAWDVRFGISNLDGKATNPDIDVWRIGGNARYTFNPTSPIRLFVNGGLGIYKFDPGDLEAGANLGLGLRIPINPRFSLEATYNYHNAFTASPDLKYDQIQAGLLISF